jgi:cytochrome c
MKKIIAFTLMIGGFLACNSTEEKKATSEPVKKNEITDNPDYNAGLDLVTKSDCFTCHKFNEKLVGPSYKDVANKYPNTPENISLLGDKIINGGQNVWGTVPMTAHPTITKADAEKMVKYILLLKD